MKNSVGTSLGGHIVRRKRQNGNRLCKKCVHLQYKPTAEYNYFCDKSGEPKYYTTRCFCKHYKEKSNNGIEYSP